MISFDVQISGDTATIQRLSAIEHAIDTTPPLDAVRDAALPTLRIYPPELPNQRYVRTEELKHGWQANAAGTVITLDNPVDHAIPVYSDTDQAAIHRGRWKTLTELRKAVLPPVLDAYRAWVAQVVQR